MAVVVKVENSASLRSSVVTCSDWISMRLKGPSWARRVSDFSRTQDLPDKPENVADNVHVKSL